MRLAEQHDVVLISADSRQIYRGFDIGTAKPTAAERRRVPHRGIDVIEPSERYSAAAWSDAAEVWLRETIASGRQPVIVGGTGFYLRALFGPLFDEPVLDGVRRREIERELGHWSHAELRRWTTILDPARAHLGRAQLLRSIEIALLTGRRLSELHRSRARPARYLPRYLIVDPGGELAVRIAARLDAMLASGWSDEVRTLMERVPDEAPAWQGTGYATMRRYIRGEIEAASAREAILIETRQYAKRQRTWFRHQLPPERVTRVDPMDGAWRQVVDRWWTARGNSVT